MNNPDGIIEFGPQPIDGLMNTYRLNNADIVDASTEQINHKMVAKARRGRKLSRKVQFKILRAFNRLLPEGQKEYQLKDLFNY